MAVSSVCTSFTICFVIYLHLAHSTVYQIRSSLDHDCPEVEQTCVTLSDFSNNFTINTNNDNESVTLLFLPGYHTLESQLIFTNVSSVAMIKSLTNTTMVSEPVIITCNNDAKFEFIELNSLLVVGLTFVGCTGTKVESVHTFTLEDSIFEGRNVGTALKLDRVAASVVRSSFSSYGGESIEYFVRCCYYWGFTPYHATLRVGGAIIANHSRLVIYKSEFQHNMADIGGVIYSVHQSSISITNSNFTYNSANFVSLMDYYCFCGGGVLQSDNSSSIYISNSQFIGSNASESGGVVSVVDSGGVNSDISITITNNSTFTDNRAGQDGGVVSVYSSDTSNSNITLTISDCDIMNNNAGHGGALSVYSEYTSNSNMTLTFNDCDIMNNNAGHGGALSVYSEYTSNSNMTLTFNDCDIMNNNAGHGGALSVYSEYTSNSNMTLTFNDCDIMNNNAGHGGVVSVYSYSTSNSNMTLTISDVDIMNNNADWNGGVVSVNSEDSTDEEIIITVTDSDFTNNRALVGGVFDVDVSSFRYAAYLPSVTATLAIAHSKFIHNTATYRGGGVIDVDMYSRGQSVTVVVNISDHSIFSDNKAIESSGGMIGALGYGLRLGSLAVHIADSEINHNEADNGGGVVSIEAYSLSPGFTAYLVFTGCKFIENQATHGSVVNIEPEGSDYFHSYVTQCEFCNNTATNDGGVLYLVGGDNMKIIDSEFIGNRAGYRGGVAYISSVEHFTVIESQFSLNSAGNSGGVIVSTTESDSEGTINITRCSFTHNSVDTSGRGGVLNTQSGHLFLELTNFTSNVATSGGVLWIEDATVASFLSAIFDGNLAEVDGGVMYSQRSNTNFSRTIFVTNRADNNGGTMFIDGGSILIKNSKFFNNSAGNDGGVIKSYLMDSASIEQCNFTSNEAEHDGGVISIDQCVTNITETLFEGNKANAGGVMRIEQGNTIMSKSTLLHNEASAGGVIWAKRASISSIRLKVTHNHGDFCVMQLISSECVFSSISYSNNTASILAQDSSVHIDGESSLTNNVHPPHMNYYINRVLEGGALTAFQSRLFLRGVCEFQNNSAIKGGALNVIQSDVEVLGQVTLTDNRAREAGGGIHLCHSDLICKDNSTLKLQRNAGSEKGGGIMTVTSNIKVKTETSDEILMFENNHASKGGGLYFEMSSSLVILKSDANTTHSEIVTFHNNSASYGGAIYVSDDGMCSLTTLDDCPFQALAMYSPMLMEDDTTDTRCKNVLHFNNNIATSSGEDLFGGLLDRCKVSMFAEPNVNNVNMDYSFSNGTVITNGYEYLMSISNIVGEHISSEPIRVCFCKDGSGQPDCDYQPLPIIVKKGQQRNITLSLSVVDQIHKPLKKVLIISQFESGNYICQNHIQNTDGNCQEIDFAIDSDNVTEELIISVGEGPCKDTEKSQARVTLNYQCNNCPIGFEIDESIDSCHCDCDSQLWPHFTNCSGYLLVRDSNVWVTYINESEDSSHYQYLIHPYCPYNYCHDSDAMIEINLSEPNGADAQCVSNHAGLICGRCARGFSLSIGSSRCVKCPKRWPLITVGIIVGSIIGGIALVALLLILNLTVATGTLNGIILYANIVSSNSSTFFPPTVSKFVTFFISWLNLEAGFDSCFFEGLDAYWKTFLQLVFPSYIIFLVVVVIIVSEHSPRFAKMIGRRNPVATLATLILFSYTKLLGSIISSLSFTVLNYPNNTRQLVWLPDASVSFLSGKHICLFVIALLILLTGLVYTMLLVFWQLFLRLPDKRVFSWIRYQKLCHFIEPYHAPYNFEHRYWTGLLLLVRVIVYVVTAANVSGNPQFPLLVIIIAVGCLPMLNKLHGSRVYKKWPTDIIETMMYFNIVSFAALTWYYHDTASIQEAIAHISVTFTFILFLVVIFYHVYKYTGLYSLIEKKRVLEIVKAKVLRKEVEQPAEENPQPVNNDNKPHKVTFTEIELSNRHVI